MAYATETADGSLKTATTLAACPAGMLREGREARFQKWSDNREGVVFGALQWLMPLKRLMVANLRRNHFGGLSRGDASRRPPRLVASPAAATIKGAAPSVPSGYAARGVLYPLAIA